MVDRSQSNRGKSTKKPTPLILAKLDFIKSLIKKYEKLSKTLFFYKVYQK